VLYVTLNLVSNHNDIRAKRYEKSVNRYAKRFNINKSLIYAVIKTESNFNPFAVSHAPAYGLMQLVPTSGGRDAYYYVKGKDVAPKRDYLFNSDNNIELGTAYLNIISRDYLKNIQNPVSREYCTIAAYNTGSGNVLRTFSRDRKKAVHIINTLHPSETYRKLRSELNSKEARRYLEKVTKAQKGFVNI
jgi:membrane-bound lytic murein transglycosylase C